jgi:hypothetical protein
MLVVILAVHSDIAIITHADTTYWHFSVSRSVQRRTYGFALRAVQLAQTPATRTWKFSRTITLGDLVASIKVDMP